MMMEYTHSAGKSFLEESMMGEALWEPDMVLFNESVDASISTLKHDTGPANFEDSFKSGSVNGLQVGGYDWTSSGVDILDAIVNSDFDKSILLRSENQKTTLASSTLSDNKQIQPPSPANSYDSGVSSPGSDLSSVLESSPIKPSHTEYSEDNILKLESTFDPQCDANSYFNFPVHDSDQSWLAANDLYVLTHQLEEISSEPNQHCTVVPQLDFGTKATHLTVDELDTVLNPSISLHNSTAVENSNVTQDLLFENASAVEVMTTTTKSTKSRCGRKSKATTSAEKKQRKRDQNKNAATRYREKKRQEAQERETEYNSLHSRNKNLREKISQISQEMNYLRELMLEVYKLKKLIV